MTYEETIDWLYGQLPMFSRVGAAAYKKDLHNTLALLDLLNNPQESFKSVHIAGTNGKGSTSHMLAAIFQQAGYKTGLYTSPHIHDFRERIRINGEMVKREFVVAFTERMKQACQDIEPSFFELTVAMAFEYFSKEKVDIAIIETGMGGRLDSTNVITPELSVITNIGFDHMAILGNTLEEIATEKAGIIKPGIPVVIGEELKETKPVFEHKARQCSSEMHFAAEEFSASITSYSGHQLICSVIRNKTLATEMFKMDLTGSYQSKNLCTVLSAVEVLRKKGFFLEPSAVRLALEQVKKMTGLRGRWDVLRSKPDVILDVAHNKDGIMQVLDQLNRLYPDARRHFIMGFVQDKDIRAILALLDPNDSYYFTQAHLPRALPHESLQQQALEAGLTGDSYNLPDDALAAAIARASEDDVIIVCGSFFVIAEISGY